MTKIHIMSRLEKALSHNKISVNNYLPAYNGESAGLDLYNASESLTILPSSSAFLLNKESVRTLIPTGLQVAIPHGYVGLIQERGSITKSPLKVRAGVIDSGYTGEIFVNCINVGPQEFTIYENSKLPFQLVIVKCDNQFDLVTEEEYLTITSDVNRKSGMIGSSD